MKTSTKNIIFGVLALVIAVMIASVLVNVALTFLAAALKFALIAVVALVLLGVGWVWWARIRSRN
jgi:uncharacterized protein YacL